MTMPSSTVTTTTDPTGQLTSRVPLDGEVESPLVGRRVAPVSWSSGLEVRCGSLDEPARSGAVRCGAARARGRRVRRGRRGDRPRWAVAGAGAPMRDLAVLECLLHCSGQAATLELRADDVRAFAGRG